MLILSSSVLVVVLISFMTFLHAYREGRESGRLPAIGISLLALAALVIPLYVMFFS